MVESYVLGSESIRLTRTISKFDGAVSMEPTQELVDAIYREKVLRARATPPEQKLLAGADLFALACELTKAGIRSQFPDADDRRVVEILQQRLDLSRRLEESHD